MDLTKILKTGDRVYSDIYNCYGLVTITNNKQFPIQIEFDSGFIMSYNKYGSHINNGTCLLFPSDKEKSWTKIILGRDFKPFDKVLVRNRDNHLWRCAIYSHYDKEIMTNPFVVIDSCVSQCIPYNSETEHLVGTKEKCPDKYIIW